jgi:hypothetical protein
MFFHSLAVIGTPADQTLALKISYARALLGAANMGEEKA